MTTYVGIRELKAKLSEYLDRAAAGETIVVLHRGKPKAEIKALSVEERIQQGIREGWIRPGRGRASVERLGFKGRRTIAEVLDEDRGE
ncbi:MAG TPA: type II toxin-antitoxin system prevent-host-death family antitoxin [Gaiellaceae bacterium]|nr:type II toxin-antitoxin system prevent-host-death family antitoxin [Gaiellaceae bacterium]